MNLIESLIINDILILFPILIYQFYIVYQSNLKREKIDIIFSIVLLLSLYLCITFNKYIPLDYKFISIILPLLISYIFKRSKDSIFANVILIIYIIQNIGNDIYLIICFILLLVSYIYYIKTDKTINYLINLFILTVSLYNIVNYNFISIIIFSINIKIINYMISTSNDIIKLHMNLKEFEKEKNIKINLFKITHEIKNPLAVIKGYLDMFNPKDIDKSKKYVSIMKTEVNRTLNLLSDFMEFTKIKINKEEMCLNNLFDDLKDVLIPLFKAKNVNYKFNIEDNIYINADFNRLKQVILNVIKNSIEACNNKGLVSTTVFKEGNNVFIYVKDNGQGMDKDTLERLSEPFFTTKEKGTGLGVSLSKEIINSHGGNITYSSIVKKGTVCKITIPKD